MTPKEILICNTSGEPFSFLGELHEKGILNGILFQKLLRAIVELIKEQEEFLEMKYEYADLLRSVHFINSHLHRCVVSHLCPWDVFEIKNFPHDYSSYLDRLNACMLACIHRSSLNLIEYKDDYGSIDAFEPIQ